MVASVLATVALAACGSSGSGSSTGFTPTTRATKNQLFTSAPKTPAQLASDKALARRAVLTVADVPVGYAASPHKDSGGDLPDAEALKFANCAHVPKSIVREMMGSQQSAASADSPDFDHHAADVGAVHIENNVELERSVADVRRPVELFGARGALPCWNALFQKAAQQSLRDTPGVTEHLNVVPLTIPGVGDETAALEAQISATGPRGSAQEYLDFYFVGRGRAVISLLVESSAGPIPPTFSGSLIRKVVDRLDAGA